MLRSIPRKGVRPALAVPLISMRTTPPATHRKAGGQELEKESGMEWLVVVYKTVCHVLGIDALRGWGE